MVQARVDETTVRLDDSVGPVVPSSLWLVWAGAETPAPLELKAATTTLGRGAEVDIALELPGVSRRHAEIVRQGPLFVVRDLGSTNGTHLNGSTVSSNALSEGDVLRLGDAVAAVIRQPAPLGVPRVAEPVPGVLFGPGLASVLSTLQAVARGSLPVVLWGPTGVGKEGMARTLHHLSGRSGPLHAVNCGALPAALAEAELFGHRKGAFTGADQAGLGHVRAAHGGTLFLDELADLPPAVQVKLLRVLQEHEVVPVGETRAQPVDVRVVAASLIPLEELVATRHLREDLAARLAGVTVEIPRLEQRRADIAPLFAHFLRQHSGGRAPAVEGRLLEQLLLQGWPGNVRELELLARRLLSLHGHEATLRRSFIQARAPATSPPPPRVARRASPEEDEPQLERLREGLRQHGNLTRAAQEAGISRQRAYRLMGDRSRDELVAEGSGEDPTTRREDG